ncbi:hypothetical protein [Dehalobacter restrictus]
MAYEPIWAIGTALKGR